MEITKWRRDVKLPPKFRKDKDRPAKGWFSDKTKLKAVQLWMQCGNLSAVADKMNIPYMTIRAWKYKTDWWDKIVQEQRGESDQKKDATIETITQKALAALEDRIDRGDHILDSRTGEVIQVPLKGKDLATISKSLHQQQKDIREIPVQAAAQQATNEMLVDLAKQFAEIASGKKGNKEKLVSAEEVEDVEFTEVISGKEDSFPEKESL